MSVCMYVHTADLYPAECANLIGEELHDEVALSLNLRRTRSGLELEPLVKAVHG